MIQGLASQPGGPKGPVDDVTRFQAMDVALPTEPKLFRMGRGSGRGVVSGLDFREGCRMTGNAFTAMDVVYRRGANIG